MDFSTALPTFLITLREGVEAALVIGIVLAALKQAQQTRFVPWVYGGILVGLVASALLGISFSQGLQALEALNPLYVPVSQPLLEALLGLVAVAMLTWMLLWMTRQARQLKGEVTGSVQTVLQSEAAGWGVFSLITITVLREGFESVIFILAQFQQGWVPVLGAIAGVIGAVIIGILLFGLGVKINLRLFFQLMGTFLLLIVAGLIVGVLHHFDDAIAALAQIHPQYQALCFWSSQSHPGSCLLGPQIWNAASWLPERQFPGIVLKALFGYRQSLYLGQAVAYSLFLLVTGRQYYQSLVNPQPVAVPSAVAEPASDQT